MVDADSVHLGGKTAAGLASERVQSQQVFGAGVNGSVFGLWAFVDRGTC